MPMTKTKKASLRSFLSSPKVAPYVFVAPFILFFLICYVYPFLRTIEMSMQQIYGFDDVTFIGLNNYRRLNNPHFFNALKTTTAYTFWTSLVLIPLPIILALFLNNPATRGKGFFKGALLMPALTSVIVAGIFFRYAFGEQATTLVNAITGVFGIAPRVWLQERGPAMFALVVLCTWRWLGVNIVYFLSGLQAIPRELYEAAAIDGANAWNCFLRITLPSLKPVIIYVITISIHGGYSMFAESFAYWQTHTPGDIGMTIVSYLYQMGFNDFDMGFASAIGVTLLFIVMLLNLVQLTIMGFFKKEAN